VGSGVELRFATSFGVALIAASFLAQAGGALAGCADVFRFEANARVGVVDIAGLRPYSGPDDTVAERWLSVQEFRPTARPTREGWTGLAVVYASTTGVPVDTIGGVLWTRKPEGFAEGRVATYGGSAEAREARFADAATAGACPAGFVVRLDKTGRLTAGGKSIGVVFPDPAR
jgi:hypothetical protein